jgi:hypothetical protein
MNATPPPPDRDTPGTGPAPARSIAGDVQRNIAGAARAAAPVVRSTFNAFADWLVSISWGRFFLLSLLLLIVCAAAFSLFFKGNDQRPIDRGEITVNVNVVPLPDQSMLIESAEGRHRNPVVIHPGRKSAHHHDDDEESNDDDAFVIQGDGEHDPSVRIDNQGVHIMGEDRKGAKESIIIDKKGMRIEHLGADGAKAPAAAGDKDPAARDGGDHARGAAPAPGKERTAPPAPADASGAAAAAAALDPDKVAEAVESARDQIQTILQDQVDDRLEKFHLEDRAERSDWLASLAIVFILVSIILKVILGSKTRAESQARQASATAAQEGLKRQLAEAQLKMMQAQVEPHFLFNTLASVDYLIETDPARASRMQKNLIQYLRAALPQMREGTSSLGRELQQCRSYLEILKVRMDDRLQFSINVPMGLQSAAFPPMMLLTLVENAIKHGLEPKPEGGTLSVSAIVSNGSLQVAVADSGLGFGASQRSGTGVGLANVRERLQALFGSAAQLQIEANADGGTIATIVVPYRVDPAAAGGAAVPGAAPAAGVA